MKHQKRKRTKRYSPNGRKRLQPIAMSGEYKPTTRHITPEQLLACIDYAYRYRPDLCWPAPRPEDIRIGFLHGPSWYLAEASGKRTIKRRVVELLYEHWYQDTLITKADAQPYRSSFGILYYHYLRRTCKSAGCVNPHHYRKEVNMRIFPHESYELIKHCIRTSEVVLVPTDNKDDAKQIRAQLYNHMKKFAVEYPEFAKEMAQYVLSPQDNGLEIQPVHKGNYDRVKSWGITTIGEPLPTREDAAPDPNSIDELLKTATPIQHSEPEPADETEEPASIAEMLYGSGTVDDEKKT